RGLGPAGRAHGGAGGEGGVVGRHGGRRGRAERGAVAVAGGEGERQGGEAREDDSAGPGGHGQARTSRMRDWRSMNASAAWRRLVAVLFAIATTSQRTPRDCT